MFIPSKMLQKSMNAQPRVMYDIVGALMGYISVDRQFKTKDFEEAIQYVLSNGVSESELFQKFDAGLVFEEDFSKWDEEYYSFARDNLKENFCKKRIDHVKAVAKKLYPSVGGAQSTGKKSQGQQTQKERPIPKKRIVVITVAVVGAAVLLAVVILKLVVMK